MRISDWSSDVCSSDLHALTREFRPLRSTRRVHIIDAFLVTRSIGETQGGVPVAIAIDIHEQTPDTPDRHREAEGRSYREHGLALRNRELVRGAGRDPAPR